MIFWKKKNWNLAVLLVNILIFGIITRDTFQAISNDELFFNKCDSARSVFNTSSSLLVMLKADYKGKL